MTLRHLLHRLIHDSAPGITGVLEYLNAGRQNKMSLQLLTNKVNANSESHTLNVQEAEAAIDRINGNIAIAEYFAAKSNAVVVVLPDDGPMGDMCLLDAFLQCQKSQGDFSAELMKDYADGKIDEREFARISKTIRQTVAQLLELENAIKQVVQ